MHFRIGDCHERNPQISRIIQKREHQRFLGTVMAFSWSPVSGCFIIGYIIYGSQPQVSASQDALVAFYNGDRAHILIATVFFGLAVLNLMWFASAIRTTLADAGQDG